MGGGGEAFASAQAGKPGTDVIDPLEACHVLTSINCPYRAEYEKPKATFKPSQGRAVNKSLCSYSDRDGIGSLIVFFASYGAYEDNPGSNSWYSQYKSMTKKNHAQIQVFTNANSTLKDMLEDGNSAADQPPDVQEKARAAGKTIGAPIPEGRYTMELRPLEQRTMVRYTDCKPEMTWRCTLAETNSPTSLTNMVAVRDWACAMHDDNEGIGLKPPTLLDHVTVEHKVGEETSVSSLITVFEVHLFNRVARLGNSIKICVAHLHSGTGADSWEGISQAEEDKYFLALEDLEHKHRFDLLCTDASISLLATQ